MRTKRRTTGQAIVEFALAATLIFFLLAAAVDLGLLFFSLQAVRVAAQEGATYGRIPEQVVNNQNTLTEVRINYDEVIKRIRASAGTPSVGLVNLYDLNNNGVDDLAEGAIANANNTNLAGPVTTGAIQIDNPQKRNPTEFGDMGADPCPTNVPGQGMRNAGQNCWIRVRVFYTYRFFFPLAPAFGPRVTFPVTYSMQIRSEYAD